MQSPKVREMQEENTMSRFRVFTVATVMLFAMAALAQQAAQSGAPAHKMPNLEDHLKFLSQKLDLTAQQEDQIRPILQEMQDSMQKAMDDQSLSREERMQQMKAAHETADKKARGFLNDEQKKTLDELERQQHQHAGQHNGAH
jgi:Spy/CpxP family protein refolding chaperone